MAADVVQAHPAQPERGYPVTPAGSATAPHGLHRVVARSASAPVELAGSARPAPGGEAGRPVHGASVADALMRVLAVSTLADIAGGELMLLRVLPELQRRGV